MKTIERDAWIVEQYETSDFCGIVGSQFKPEVYTDELVAKKRYSELKTLPEHSDGLPYTMYKIKLFDTVK